MAKEGIKHDSGKVQPLLIMSGFPLALTEVARVATFGANKYAPGNWKKVKKARIRYINACYRHLLEYHSKFSPKDSETSIHQLAHAAWNILATLELDLRKLKELGTLCSGRDMDNTGMRTK